MALRRTQSEWHLCSLAHTAMLSPRTWLSILRIGPSQSPTQPVSQTDRSRPLRIPQLSRGYALAEPAATQSRGLGGRRQRNQGSGAGKKRYRSALTRPKCGNAPWVPHLTCCPATYYNRCQNAPPPKKKCNQAQLGDTGLNAQALTGSEDGCMPAKKDAVADTHSPESTCEDEVPHSLVSIVRILRVLCMRHVAIYIWRYRIKKI